MALSEMEEAILEQLEVLVRLGRPVDQAAQQLRRMGIHDELIARAVEFRAELAKVQREQTLNAGALWDPEMVGPPWYTGRTGNDLFWPKLEELLLADPSWAGAVDSLDNASHDIVGLLQDPHSPRINTRGLVIGHVQSGKTANFTATIAKAADAGYRMFIVLSGVHNALRRQTQLRLERHLHDLQPKRWLVLTDEHRDFGNPVKALALVAGTDLRLLAVVKKNASRLRRLRDWLYAAQEHGGFDTCPVLIIDDEADQASPNSARNPDLDRTTINDLIVEILRLPRVAYVGYTATPFANVLIDPEPPEDLYPRHFIYALDKPPGYFGAETLFGLGLTGEEDDPEHDMIRRVPDDEARLHRVHRGHPFEAQLTDRLADAVAWFLLATAARRVRSNDTPHSSMLIHTTENVAAQFAYLPVVRDGVRAVRGALDRRDIEGLRALWMEETSRESAAIHGLETPSFDSVIDAVPSVLDDVKIVVDNGQSTERLLYDQTVGTTVIAIGGNTLSRGLTLEGLISSFFLRGANAYDTLLQMGRWFGYRAGYGDLPRIWTTADLAEGFRFLADVERDIRAEIARYGIEQTTPLDVAVRIKLHPKMQVTNRLRMQFAVPATSSFSAQRPQTILFHHRDPTTVDANLAAGRAFISDAVDSGSVPEIQPNRIILRDISTEIVLSFLSAYRFHEDSEMSSSLLRGYIAKQNSNGDLTVWNAAVITRQTESRQIDLGLGPPVNLIDRSRIAGYPDPMTANIGTLMSKPDRVADLMDANSAVHRSDPQLVEDRTESGRGLVLFYPIDSDSKPKAGRVGAKVREPLDAVGDLIGVAIAFPKARMETDPSSTIAVDLSRVRPVLEDRDEEDATEEEYSDQEGDHNDVDLGGDD
jgi:hypothetical protein